MIWWILAGVAGIAFFFMGPSDRPNAIGGGATIGLIVGIIIAIFYRNWWLIGRAIIVGVLIGLLFEALPHVLKRIRP